MDHKTIAAGTPSQALKQKIIAKLLISYTSYPFVFAFKLEKNLTQVIQSTKINPYITEGNNKSCKMV